MTIQVHSPELEELIQERMRSGIYRNVEDALLAALKSSRQVNSSETPRTGRDLIAAMQACPYPEVAIEPERFPLPVRDVVF